MGGTAVTIIAVDPGVSNMGVVVSDGKRILSTQTFRTKADGKPTTESVMARVMDQTDALAPLVMSPHALLVVEGYEDIPGEKRGARYRWTTPMLLGAIGILAEMENVDIVWQSPKVVMTRYREHKAMMAQGVEVMEGSRLATNDHERSAVCHLLAFLDGHHD